MQISGSTQVDFTACNMSCEISQAESLHFAQKADFAASTLWFCSLRNCLSSWCNLLPMTITSSFQLWFVHRLKRWTPDFSTSKWHMVCIKWTLGSAWNVSKSCCPLEFLHVRFLSLFSLFAFLICFWQRTIKLQSLDYSCKWASICFAMDSIQLSSILDCVGDKKSYQKHQNLTQFD